MGLLASQVAALALACQIGAPHDLCDTAQAIVLLESSACLPTQLVGKHGELGCAQIKLGTARRFDPYITETQLKVDKARNMRIMVAILRDCRQSYKTWKRMLVCYNEGRAGSESLTDAEVAHHIYVRNIADKLHVVRRGKNHGR